MSTVQLSCVLAGTFGPLTVRPRHMTVQPVTADDKCSVWIRALLLDNQSSRVFMTDCPNSSLKALSLTAPPDFIAPHDVTATYYVTAPYDVTAPCDFIAPYEVTAPHNFNAPHDVTEVKLDAMPWGLALLPSPEAKLVAVTSLDNNVIHIIDVTDAPTLVKKIYTKRRYVGVGAFGEKRLVVSCCREGRSGKQPSVDIISLGGRVETTVVTAQQVPALRDPRYLCVSGTDAYLSDFETACLHKVALPTGQVTDTLTHPQLRSPCQVCADHTGNDLYVASKSGQCVLALDTRSGQWRRVLQGRQDGEGAATCPRAVSVSDTSLLVSWERGLGDSVVKRHVLR